MPCNGEPSGWQGETGIDRLPPDAYWSQLKTRFRAQLVDKLRAASDDRNQELTAGVIFGPAEQQEGTDLLATFGADGWADCDETFRCGDCGLEREREEYENGRCGDCDADNVLEELIYERQLPSLRPVEWAIVIHGMNTDGAWQEEFSWFFGTSQGRSVPVAVYKYGWITTGVIRERRREQLKRDLREKLLMLQRQARRCGIEEKPDLVVHSFGTWLIGHLLRDEVTKQEVRFGRVILTGCVLRPDFSWHEIKKAGLVEEVLNHYGTRDPVVPWAHWTIRDSGPSGLRGFDRDPASKRFEVLNIKAAGYGHSDLFSVRKCVVLDRPLQACPEDGSGIRHLEHTFARYWKPFLSLPKAELASIPQREDPPKPWRQAWWPFRGTLFPFVALPWLLALIVGLLALVGGWLDDYLRLAWLAAAPLFGLVVLLLSPPIVRLVRGGSRRRAG